MNQHIKNDFFFQQNALCNMMHNDRTIWFSKFEFILEEFKKISKLESNIVFICGNSDYTFTEEIFLQKPDNVKYIYATNSSCSDNKIVFSLPIGIESTFDTKRIGHGIGFDFAENKEKNIERVTSNNFNIKNLIYSNFSINTNIAIRQNINNVIKKSKYVTIENNVDINTYFNQIASHEAVLCPIGNGLDTVRTYETFYCNKIPIIYGSDIIYKNIFVDMPCVYVESLDEINDENHITLKIQEAKNKKNKINKAYLKYWIDNIYQKSFLL